MTLFDDTTAHNSESTSAVATEAEPTASEPTSTQPRMSEHRATESKAKEQRAEVNQAATPAASAQEAPQAATPSDDKPAGEDFASALENFTTETEESVGEDRVIKGTVLKLTSTHVVVDVGAKSEGMLPLAAGLDHEGKPKGRPGAGSCV